jgi:hypothetical protein
VGEGFANSATKPSPQPKTVSCFPACLSEHPKANPRDLSFSFHVQVWQ